MITWIEQIFKALSYMRKSNSNSIHRDIKIDNILLKDNQVYLSDFGTRKDLINDGTSSLAGTTKWGAPEQFIPRPINELKEPDYAVSDRSDIYPCTV